MFLVQQIGILKWFLKDNIAVKIWSNACSKCSLSQE